MLAVGNRYSGVWNQKSGISGQESGITALYKELGKQKIKLSGIHYFDQKQLAYAIYKKLY